MTGIEIDPKMPELKELAEQGQRAAPQLQRLQEKGLSVKTGVEVEFFFLQNLIRDNDGMSLEDAHWRISKYCAQAARMHDRVIVACVCLQRWAS